MHAAFPRAACDGNVSKRGGRSEGAGGGGVGRGVEWVAAAAERLMHEVMM